MHEAPIIDLGGFRLDLSVLLMLVVTSLIVFVICKLATRNLSVDNPVSCRTFGVGYRIRTQSDFKYDGHEERTALPYSCNHDDYVHFVGNMLGLPFGVVTGITEADQAKIAGQPLVSVVEAFNTAHEKNPEAHPHIEIAWWKSPTADLSVTMGLAIIAFLIAHGLGLFKNTKAYLKHYFQPHWLFFPINIVETASKLLTHGMRLFANIFAGEVLISTIMKLTAFKWIGAIAAIPLLTAWQGFSIFIGAIQAFVFTVLMMVYISQTVESHEEH